MTSNFLAKVISGAVLVWLSIGVSTGAGESAPANQPEQGFQAHILITGSHTATEKWVLSPPGERGGDRGRLRTVSKGQKIYFPVIATGYKPSDSGQINFVADLEIVAPSGKVIALKKCCSAVRGDPRTPGVVVLNPVVEIVFDADDPAGTYTARATVSDGSRTAAARESFRLQTGTGAQTGAALQGEPKPAPASGIKKRSRANEDARACLELSTNVAIATCAEKYR